MRIKPFFCFSFFIFLSSFFFFSCNAKIAGPLDAKGQAAFTISMSLLPRMTDLIRKLNDAGGSERSEILSAAEIANSLKNAPGVESITLKNTAAQSVEGQIKVSKVGDFLSGSAGVRFIEFNQSSGGGSCAININRQTAPEILSHFSREIRDYLEVLMAPIATGDEMSKAEYLRLVNSFFNKSISDEIASSKINAAVDLPGQVTSVKGGTFSGRRAVFDIPLIDILVLETPLQYEVKWR